MRPMENPDTTHIALVLGAAVWPDETASPSLRRRALHAADLYSEGRVSHIIGCGGLGKNPPTEAEMIRRLLVDAGIPFENILLEDKSHSTVENIRFAIPLLRALKSSKVVIVSDWYHAPRARMTARHLGLDAISDCPPLKDMPLARRIKYFLRELVAIPVYAIRLTFSKAPR